VRKYDEKLFCLTPKNLVQSLPETGLRSAPDPDSYKMLDPNTHIINADPKHCFSIPSFKL
jgi:hypothetical protein